MTRIAVDISNAYTLTLERYSCVTKKIYVLDTSVIIHDPQCFYKFDDNDVVIPMAVIEELDHLKDKKGDVASEARTAIRNLENILYHEPLKKGKLSIGNNVAEYLSNKVPDNIILNTCYSIRKDSPENVAVTLVTKDINMRIKAQGMGLWAEDYKSDLVSKELIQSQLQVVGSDFWGDLENVVSVIPGKEKKGVFHYTLPSGHVEDLIGHNRKNTWVDDGNGHLYLIGACDGFDQMITSFEKKMLMSQKAFGISPKNLEQAVAMYMLLNQEFDFVGLNGPAGTGKTFIVLACALEMVLERGLYNSIVIMRSPKDVDEGVGFFPGTEEEKMMPWMGGFTDNLEALVCDSDFNAKEVAATLEMINLKARIKYKALTCIRGRSYQKTFVIVDEVQNNTRHQVKSLVTRCGEGSKMVMMGNLSQIDTPYLNSNSSGFTHVCAKMPEFERAGIISLHSIERSRLSEFAEKNL